ncbi:MAG: Hsp20/alpha crystallin family protein [Verrucomicrobia bacterium]|nr:Hsp20/alpha crystallin family protein [Verrucomicrobiota bacterium]
MKIIRYQDPELGTWSPLNRLASLREEMNRLLDGSLAGFSENVGLFGGWSPSVDVYQDKENVYVKAELPGMKKEEIEITFQDGILTVAGERKQESEVREGESFRSERFFGKFHRSVSMPTKVEAERIKAAYKDGVLTVELPKAAEAKAKQIEVSVS